MSEANTPSCVLSNAHVDPTGVLLVGLPASGKSTWRAGLGDNFTFLSTDDIIEREAAKLGKTYSEGFKDLIGDAEKEMWATFDDCVCNGKSFVFDRTNLTVKRRRSILARIPQIYTVCAVYFEIDNEERQRRLCSRPGKFIPVEVDDNMQRSYVRPDKSEGFDFVFPGGQG